jgi:phospholipid transport system substrate-binding protein
VVLGAVLVLATGLAHAQPGPWYGSGSYGPTQPRAAGPDTLVREGISKLQAFMAGGGGVEPDKAMAFIEEKIAPYFDFDYMAEWAAGYHWRRMSEQAKARLTRQIRDRFLRALARHLGAYDLPVVRVQSARRGSSPGEALVPTVVIPRRGGGAPLRLNFRFYRSPAGWKIFDVTANNQSAVMYYRQQFNQSMRRAAMPSPRPARPPQGGAPTGPR